MIWMDEKKYKKKGDFSRAPTAEDTQKQDIALRWVDLINAVSFLKRRTICGEGSITKALAYFIERFYGFFYATQFYIRNKELKNKIKKEFLDIEKPYGRINVQALLNLVDEYVYACYLKGLFLSEEAIGEEGFEEEEEKEE